MNRYRYVEHSGIISVVLCLLMLLFFGCQKQPKEIPITTVSDEARQLFIEGRDKWDNVEREAAIPLFDKAIEKDPNFALAYFYRAYSGGGFNVLQENLQRAVSLADGVSEGERHMILYGKAATDANSTAQKEHLDKLLELYPSDKRVHEWAGLYYRSVLRDFDKALEHFTRASELDDSYASVQNYIGYLHFALDNYEAAEEAFKRYIELNPESPNPYDSYAELLMRMGRFDESIEQYKKAYEQDNAFVSALVGVGNNYVFKGDYSKARETYQEYFDKSTAVSGRLSALLQKAISYVHEGNVNQAIKVFGEYRSLAKENDLQTNVILSYAWEGFVLTESDKTTQGRKQYEKAIEEVGKGNLPETTREYYRLYSMMWRCYTLGARKDFEKANEELEHARQTFEQRKNPDEERDWQGIAGWLALQQGKSDEALEHLSKASQLNPYVLYHKALAYSKKGDEEAASELFSKVANWNSNSLNLAIVRAKALKRMGG